MLFSLVVVWCTLCSLKASRLVTFVGMVQSAIYVRMAARQPTRERCNRGGQQGEMYREWNTRDRAVIGSMRKAASCEEGEGTRF